MTYHYPGFDRITSDPEVLGGKPCIRGLRISVQRVLELLAREPDWADLRAGFPELEHADIQQALAFAAASMEDRVVPLSDSAA